MRITRANMEELQASIERMIAALGVIEDSVTTWIDNQDEQKNEYVRDDIRDARTTVTDGMDEVQEAAEELAGIIRGRSKR